MAAAASKRGALWPEDERARNAERRARVHGAARMSATHAAAGAHPLMKLPLLYIVTGTSRVSMAVRADVIWMRTVYLVEISALLMVVHSVGIVMK